MMTRGYERMRSKSFKYYETLTMAMCHTLPSKMTLEPRIYCMIESVLRWFAVVFIEYRYRKVETHENDSTYIMHTIK